MCIEFRLAQDQVGDGSGFVGVMVMLVVLDDEGRKKIVLRQYCK